MFKLQLSLNVALGRLSIQGAMSVCFCVCPLTPQAGHQKVKYTIESRKKKLNKNNNNNMLLAGKTCYAYVRAVSECTATAQ